MERAPSSLKPWLGTVTANATARGGDNPAADYQPADDSSVQAGGNGSSQEDSWEAERYPRDPRGDPGSQSVSHPQSDGQPSERAEPRVGLAGHHNSPPTREEASTCMLELVDRHTNRSHGAPIRACTIAGVWISERRPMTEQSRCRKGTKASVKIAALNIRGMGNTNTWHPDNKWNHLSILGVYAPVNPVENARFWASINQFFEENPNVRKPDVMAGDMNITEDPIDRLPIWQDYASAVDSLDEMRTSLQLIDGWNSMNEHCYKWTIEKSGVPTDHALWVMREYGFKERNLRGICTSVDEQTYGLWGGMAL
ncbi:hypothetical protein ARMGADRAFT_1037745 [Armillaria gallica]|uniref:DNase I-like protein n=1 Tax=Armillaria gallica TaxID=47427 RepID=A0A2H3CKF7_ARMGA|nr:hypothetical protein ARMGADRAFT_1037745 [Armillaria gallica]